MKKKVSMMLAIVLMISSVSCMAEFSGFLEPYKGLLKGLGRLGLLIAEDSLWEYGEENVLSSVRWEMLSLDESTALSHPELAASLDEINRQRIADSEALSEELTELAGEIFGGEEGAGYCSGNFNCYVQRADNAVLSFRSDSEIYWGGAHPDYGTAGVNLDPATGEEIMLSDVVLDKNVLATLLARGLQEKYTDILFEDDLETRLLSFNDDELEWTLGYDGITFYFNPYMILPYAAGKTTVTIRYNEAKELFNPGYLLFNDQAFAVEIPLFEEIEFDLNPADSQRDIIMLSGLMGEYEAYEQLWIAVNGEYRTEEIYAYNLNAYLAATGTGYGSRSFLYVEFIGDSGYPTLLVYDLNSGSPVIAGEISGSEFAGGLYSGKAVLTDPGSFRLDTRLDILGTRFGFKEYAIDERSGMPIPQQNDYELYNYGYPITSLIPLEVVRLDDMTEQTVPAGTEFYALRTDGETYMDFSMTDGSECRIEIDTSDYPNRINGIPEEECFEGIMYAG